MLYAIFSDIHSNLEAYQAFLGEAERKGVKRYLCVGDIVGYGADPHQCIELTKELGCPIVCGNHDWAVAEKIGIDYFNYNAKRAVEWTQQVLDDIDKNFLANLEPVYQNGDMTLVHASLNRPEEFSYVLSIEEAARSIVLQQTALSFIGHSHIAGIFYEDKDGDIGYTIGPEMKVAAGRRYLVNVGSIGQPRDGDWRGSYCLYDDEKKRLQIKRLDYDVKRAQEKILKAGLPSRLAVRLAQGR